MSEERLNSLKEIGTYLQRNEATARRWEKRKEEGQPQIASWILGEPGLFGHTNDAGNLIVAQGNKILKFHDATGTRSIRWQRFGAKHNRSGLLHGRG